MRNRMNLFGMNMARRSARRWLVAVIVSGLLAGVAIAWASGSNNLGPLLMLATIVNWFILGGYGRRGLVKPFVECAPVGAPAPWQNDERERHRRDRMHFHAYRFIVGLLILAYTLGLPPFHALQASRAFMLAGVVLGLTLPQALVLWTEPDVEVEEPAVLEAHPLR